MAKDNDVGVVNLVDAGVPADQGLSSLGLLMQLGGSVLAAYACLISFVVLFAVRNRADSLWIFLILGLCITRSMFHRTAGSQLLYPRRGVEGTPGSPLAGVRRYIAVALGQTAVLVLVMLVKFSAPLKPALAVAGGLAAWPLTLAVLIALPRFRRFSTEIPVGEDKGFEGAAILMTILGWCGVLGTGSIVIVMLDLGGRALQGSAVLVLLALVMLVIRSVIHVQAGMSGLRVTSVDHSVELANRYSNFGVISSFCTGCALLLVAMTSQLNLSGLALVVGLCWMLMAWPLIIRRFFSDRQFADLLAGDNASVHRRAPDAGLTGLGWLLLAHAVMIASFTIIELAFGHAYLSAQVTTLMSFVSTGGDRSIWWSVGVMVLEAWAGYELVRMSVQHRAIAIVYAVVAIAVGLYIFWPTFELLKDARGGVASESFMMILAPMATQLVIPVATLILVNRKISPMARARFRSRPVA